MDKRIFDFESLINNYEILDNLIKSLIIKTFVKLENLEFDRHLELNE